MVLKFLQGVVAAFCLIAVSAYAAEVPSLGSYSIDPGWLFVAGISSGGAMAVQLDVAYSATFKGAAIYAGLPYYCAHGDPFTALGCASRISKKHLTNLEKLSVAWAAKGLIDPLQNLRNQPVYLWSGKHDTTVHQSAVNALRSYYTDLGADVFQYDNQFPAGHGWESPYGPVKCSSTQTPFVNLCYDSNHRIYDSEQVWLSHFFGPLQPKNQGALNGAVLQFDQNEFAPGGAAAGLSMANAGYVFVPRTCAGGTTCGLLLALHGCAQGESVIGRTFINDAGLNQWADSNNIVVLYPQAIVTPTNLLGCWDWWGYLGDSAYAQKNGKQIRALYKMVVRASGGSAAPAQSR